MDGGEGVIMGAESLVLLRAGQNEATLSQLSPVSMELFVETRRNASTTQAPRLHRNQKKENKEKEVFIIIYIHNILFVSHPLQDNLCVPK